MGTTPTIAKNRGQISHGICPCCADKMFRQLKSTRNTRFHLDEDEPNTPETALNAR
jgi:hypothetical protein